MKRFVVLSVIFLCSVGSLFAASTTNQRLTFVYIAHDENMSVFDLVNRLREVYDDAVNYPDDEAAIFYLANGTEPMVATVNLGKNDEEAFFTILEDLQSKRFHDVEPDVDIARIIEVLSEHDFWDETGTHSFDRIEWRYYVNSTFWDLHNNENVISSLYWILDMEKPIREYYLKVLIYYSKDDVNFRFDSDFPFGTKNLCRGLQALPIPF